MYVTLGVNTLYVGMNVFSGAVLMIPSYMIIKISREIEKIIKENKEKNTL